MQVVFLIRTAHSMLINQFFQETNLQWRRQGGQGGGGSISPPPQWAEGPPLWKDENRGEIGGGGDDDYVMHSVPILSVNYCKLSIKVLVLRLRSTVIIN